MHNTKTLLTTNFTSLANCQQECNWCCDPNGLSVCTFVGNITNCAGTAYVNALDCYLATATNTPCDCSLARNRSLVSLRLQCYDMGGCVSNTSGLLDVNLFGVRWFRLEPQTQEGSLLQFR